MTTKLRRMPKRYLDGSPEYVIDIFHDPRFHDGISVYCATNDPETVMVFGTSVNGNFSGWNDARSWDLRLYRNDCRRYRISWAELPESVREIVAQDMRDDLCQSCGQTDESVDGGLCESCFSRLPDGEWVSADKI
jgi:hypothetical protein